MKEIIIVNEFNEYVREVFSAAGDIVIKSMMGGYLVYLNGKLTGDICGGEQFLMHVFDSFDDKALILELLNGM